MAGDRPELFDAFDVPDAEGKTLRSKFPELSEEIDTGRRQAEAARTKAIHEATEADRFDSTVLWQGHVRERPEWVISTEGQDALRSQISPTGFTAAQAASMTAAAHSELAQRQHGSEVLQAARMAAWDGPELVALCGAVPGPDLLCPWLLASSAIEKHRVAAMRHARHFVADLLKSGSTVVGNYIGKGSTANREFIQALGFVIVASPTGPHDFFFLPKNHHV